MLSIFGEIVDNKGSSGKEKSKELWTWEQSLNWHIEDADAHPDRHPWLKDYIEAKALYNDLLQVYKKEYDSLPADNRVANPKESKAKSATRTAFDEILVSMKTELNSWTKQATDNFHTHQDLWAPNINENLKNNIAATLRKNVSELQEKTVFNAFRKAVNPWLLKCGFEPLTITLKSEIQNKFKEPLKARRNEQEKKGAENSLAKRLSKF